jgi:ribose transport system ATP-binding protein
MEPALQIEGLSKTFAGVRVLDRVDLRLEPGEVHGLLGQNGSGKSTLIKVLAGFHAPDEGTTIRAYGRELPLSMHAKEISGLGWAFVHQDLGLIQELRVIDSFHLLRLGSFARPVIDWRSDHRYVADLLRRFDVNVSPDAIVGELSGAERAMVAIVRAAELIRVNTEVQEAEDERRRGLLVLDEPTAYLPEEDVQLLFALIRRVAAEGVSVLLVSHMLDEIRAITDRVTVLRDGRVTAQAATQTLSNNDLVRAIVGHDVITKPRDSAPEDLGEPVLAVRDMVSPRTDSISLQVCPGEVLGLTGLAGSGFDDIPYLLFGGQRAHSGTIAVGGDQLPLRRLRPDTAMRLGIAFIPANRLAQGAAGDQTVAANMTLTTLERYTSGFVLQRRRERAATRTLVDEYDVRPRDPERPFAQLSGGNQQKALLAKWLQDAPSVLLLHEPAQGLDVKARNQVVEIVRAFAGAGTAVICASSDFEQVEQICDRVLIFRRGRIQAELQRDEITQRRLSEESLRQE